MASSSSRSRSSRTSRLPEERVVVEGELGVEREEPALLGHRERVDLELERVGLDEAAVETAKDGHGLREERAREPEGRGELAALEVLEADGGIDRLPHDRLGSEVGDPLDLDASERRSDQRDALCGPVDDERDVELSVDPGGPLDEDAADEDAFGARLRGHEPGLEQLAGGLLDLGRRSRRADAAGLASTSCVHLRLDDPAVAAERAGGVAGLLGSSRHAAARNRDPVGGKERLRLVLVDVHACAATPLSAARCASCQAIVASSPSRSGMRASKPSSFRAFAVSGTRSRTSWYLPGSVS